MTILGIEKELQRKTPAQSITDTWTFEEGSAVVFDKSVLLSVIINRGASFCVLYPDPDYFKLMSDNWWSKWKDAFYRWLLSMQTDYNPLENYDRQEKWHDDIKDNNTLKQSGTVGTKGTNTSTNEKSAYDVSTYQPVNKVTDGIDTTDTRDLTDKIDNDRDIDHEGRVHGNIGVTTSQQMLEAEIKIRSINVYDLMADCFIKDLLIAVY